MGKRKRKKRPVSSSLPWNTRFHLRGTLLGSCDKSDDFPCNNCDLPVSKHYLSTNSHRACDQLFVNIRNARVQLSFGMPASLPTLKSVTHTCSEESCDLDSIASCLVDAAKLCDFRLKIAKLDECYHWLRYSLEHVDFPPPYIYFSSLVFDCNSFLDKLPWTAQSNDNCLLRLFYSRWLETSLLFPSSQIDSLLDFRVCGMGTSLLEQPTLKNKDPKLPTELSIWTAACRDFACRMYSFAVPTYEAVQAISEWSPIIEIGAGTGYWANLIKVAGADVIALDTHPPNLKFNLYHGRYTPHTDILKGSHSNLQNYPNHTLFLCYPPPDNTMALDALSSYTGETVIHVGEWFGDTGTLKFQQLLEKEFTLIQKILLPNWSSTSYDLTIWKRSSSKCRHPYLSCSVCQAESNLRRCRITCSQVFCTETCKESGYLKHQHALNLKHVHIDSKQLDWSDDEHFREL